MDIFDLFMLLGGLAFFLFGMNAMSGGLEQLAGGKLESSLRRMTSNRFLGLVLGAVITIAVQSSSAVTVMLVGFVNSGIMGIGQTIGVIMGSNIGTTLTAMLTSLVGLESDNVWLKLLKPEHFSLLFAFIGAALHMMSKKPKRKNIGNILVGFAVLMYGMKLMSTSVSGLADSPEFSSILTAFRNPILGVIVGAVFTGVIQSSAASVGILQALAMTGEITYGMALPIIMGQNIGTCITALISSIGVNRNAKKVAIVHILFNVIGTIVCLILFYAADAIFHFAFVDQEITPFAIAIVHMIFNVATTAMLLPFSNAIVKLANKLLPDNTPIAEQRHLDERLLATPTIAIGECNVMSGEMADTARDTLMDAIACIKTRSIAGAENIQSQETKLDKYEDILGTFLVKLSSKNLSFADSHNVAKMLHAIGDFERLGDHAVNILDVAQELHDKKLSFSDQAMSELAVLSNALEEIVELATTAYKTNDLLMATQIEPLEQVIDHLVASIRSKHIERLQAGNCTIEMGFIFSDLLINYERVSDHCSNIAVGIIEIARDSYDTHSYLNDLKYTDEQFKELFTQYSAKYDLTSVSQ